MSNFQTVSEWVNANIVPATTPTDVTPEMLRELQVMADNEVVSLSERVFRTMRDYQRQDGMRALAALTTNSYNPRHDDYMLNAFSVVVLKSDPHGTDGIFVIIQVVPGYYVLKTIIRANKDYIATAITHTYLSVYDSPNLKPYMKTGACVGTEKDNIFVNKAKVDKKERLEPMLPEGTNGTFSVTLPNGEVVIT